MPTGVIVVGPDGRISDANAWMETLVGYSPDELVGTAVDALVPERYRETHAVDLSRFFAAPKVRQMGTSRELFALRKDGREIPVEIGLSPVDLPEGPRVVATLLDVSARRQAERALQRVADELARSNQELDRFAYVASHDLRAPLVSISQLADWLASDLESVLTPETRHLLDLMRGRVGRLALLIDGLLAYSRAGRAAPDVTHVHVGDLVREIVDSLPRMEKFHVEIAPDIPDLEAPRSLLSQVLGNLIDNAVKHHHGDEGRIAIGWADRGEMLELSVADDGPGIASEHHEKVFGLFQTVRSRDEVEGAGMGLPLVTRIVERFGGSVGLSSEPGAGTTIRFTWPRRVDVGSAEPA